MGPAAAVSGRAAEVHLRAVPPEGSGVVPCDGDVAGAPAGLAGNDSQSASEDGIRAGGLHKYSIERDGETSWFRVYNDHEEFKSKIGWAFGLGAAGQTYLIERDGHWYEGRVSYYKDINGLDSTVGARPGPVRSPGGSRWARDVDQRRVGMLQLPYYGCDDGRCAQTGDVDARHPMPTLSLEQRRPRGRIRERVGAEADAGEAGSDGGRGDQRILRPVPSDVADDRRRRAAQYYQCPVPAVSFDQQQMLRRGGDAVEVYDLPRHPRRDSAASVVLRYEVPGLPFAGAEGGDAVVQSGHPGLRDVPHAESENRLGRIMRLRIIGSGL